MAETADLDWKLDEFKVVGHFWHDSAGQTEENWAGDEEAVPEGLVLSQTLHKWPTLKYQRVTPLKGATETVTLAMHHAKPAWQSQHDRAVVTRPVWQSQSDRAVVRRPAWLSQHDRTVVTRPARQCQRDRAVAMRLAWERRCDRPNILWQAYSEDRKCPSATPQSAINWTHNDCHVTDQCRSLVFFMNSS